MLKHELIIALDESSTLKEAGELLPNSGKNKARYISTISHKLGIDPADHGIKTGRGRKPSYTEEQLISALKDLNNRNYPDICRALNLHPSNNSTHIKNKCINLVEEGRILFSLLR